MEPNENAAAVDAVVRAYEELMHRLSVHRDPTAFEVAVTMPQLRLLVAISVAGELHQSTLGDRLGVSVSTVSGLVDRLVDHGYVSRHDDPADRRQVVLTVTPEGAAFLDRLRELGAQQLRRLLDRLDADGLAVVQRTFDLLLAAADAEAAEAAETPAPAGADAGAATGSADVASRAAPSAVPAATTRKDPA